MPENRSSDIHLDIRRGHGALHRQLETQLRDGIRSGRFAAGTTLPASRALATELGVSRSVVTEAYAQLAAEGWLETTERHRPRIPKGAPSRHLTDAAEQEVSGVGTAPLYVRWDLRPGAPALGMFPRVDWLRSLKAVIGSLPDAALDYPPPEGVPALRRALGAHLGRTRGVVPTDPGGPIVVAGVAQALTLLGGVLEGPVAVEDPGPADAASMLEHRGAKLLGVPVDDHGIVVEAIPAAARAVLVTPAHQYPTGVVMSAERRAQLLDWSRATGAFIIEDDYDAEFRYDRTPVGALQQLAPDQVITMSSASKTLAPGLRLGWVTAPRALHPALLDAKRALDHGQNAIDQHAFADFIERGAYDRHLRRARKEYRHRRDTLLDVLGPEAKVGGIAAGLHLTLEVNEIPQVESVAFDHLDRHRRESTGPPTLLLGYGRITAAAIPAAVAQLMSSASARRSIAKRSTVR